MKIVSYNLSSLTNPAQKYSQMQTVSIDGTDKFVESRFGYFPLAKMQHNSSVPEFQIKVCMLFMQTIYNNPSSTFGKLLEIDQFSFIIGIFFPFNNLFPQIKFQLFATLVYRQIRCLIYQMSDIVFRRYIYYRSGIRKLNQSWSNKNAINNELW